MIFSIAGAFIIIGLFVAYLVVFTNIQVIGGPRIAVLLFGFMFAYFAYSIIVSLIKKIFYKSLITCVQKYN